MKQQLAIPPVGARVRVISEYPESYYYAKNTKHIVETVGVVRPRDRYDHPNTFNVFVGRQHFPVANIAIRNVTIIEYLDENGDKVNQ